MISLSEISNWVKHVQNEPRGILLSLTISIFGGGWLGYRAKVILNDNWFAGLSFVVGSVFLFLLCALVRRVIIDIGSANYEVKNSQMTDLEIRLLRSYQFHLKNTGFFDAHSDLQTTLCDELVRKKILTRVYPGEDRFRYRDHSAKEKVLFAIQKLNLIDPPNPQPS